MTWYQQFVHCFITDFLGTLSVHNVQGNLLKYVERLTLPGIRIKHIDTPQAVLVQMGLVLVGL